MKTWYSGWPNAGNGDIEAAYRQEGEMTKIRNEITSNHDEDGFTYDLLFIYTKKYNFKNKIYNSDYVWQRSEHWDG